MAAIQPHAVREKQKLLNRVRRIKGQIEAVERTLEGEAECSQVMHLLTASSGAINSLLAEVLEDHVREHLMGDNGNSKAARKEAADELIEIIHAYLK
jgi:DNA-binding FrmR family transcriptional regulator